MTGRGWCVLHVARVAVEAVSPLSVTTGVATNGFDTALVCDADGLPALPATSIAGVLRKLAERLHGKKWAESAFGRTGSGPDEILRSLLSVSWGRLHDSHDLPARREDVHSDPILQRLGPAGRLTPLLRERVRINSKGVADAEGRGKFDRTVVPRGARFTFELQWRSDGSEQQEMAWRHVQGLLRHPDFALGGAVRSGFGQLKLVRPRGAASACVDDDAPLTARFDMKDAVDRATFTAARQAVDGGLVSLRATWPVPDRREQAITPTGSSGEAWSTKLLPRDFFRIGGQRRASGEDENAAQLRPMEEPIIVWTHCDAGHQFGKFKEGVLVVPGSSIKGVLRHRTLYHLARLLGCFVEESTLQGMAERERLDRDLFGSAKTGGDGQAGVVTVEDIFITQTAQRDPTTMYHNSIDRFTGGVREGFLFAEELVAFKEPTSAAIEPIEIRLRSSKPLDSLQRRALEMAIADLEDARATLGGGSGRGHGTFALAGKGSRFGN